MRKVTVAELQHTLDTLDAGVLKPGAHAEGSGEFCAFECLNKTLKPKLPCTDKTNGIPDLRPINDIRTGWTDEERTKALLPLIAALSDFPLWSPPRKLRWVSIVALQTVQRIIGNLPQIPEEQRKACQNAKNLSDAADAAFAAADAAAYAADAAYAAAADAPGRGQGAAYAAAADAAANAAYVAAYAAAADADAYAKDAADAANAAANASNTAIQYAAISIWLDAVAESEKE